MKEQELIEEIRNVLEKAEKPLFIIDDDPDGVCAYLLLKKYLKKGEFVLVKSAPIIGEEFLEHVHKKQPDVIIILDIANVSEEFLDGTRTPIVWIDHHEPKHPKNALYYNPRNYDDEAYVPTSECAWNIVQDYDWIAAIGIMEDWKIPPFIDRLIKEYPDLIRKTENPGELRFATEFGRVGMIIRASLKGQDADCRTCIKLFENITSPYDFEKQPDKYMLPLKKYHDMKRELDSLLEDADKKAEKTKDMIIYGYRHVGVYALTGILAEYLSYLNPDKLVLIGREKGGYYRMAIRAKRGDINVALQRAFEGSAGRGGGHKLSCGGSIPSHEFEDFIGKFKIEWKTQIEQLDLTK